MCRPTRYWNCGREYNLVALSIVWRSIHDRMQFLIIYWTCSPDIARFCKKFCFGSRARFPIWTTAKTANPNFWSGTQTLESPVPCTRWQLCHNTWPIFKNDNHLFTGHSKLQDTEKVTYIGSSHLQWLQHLDSYMIKMPVLGAALYLQ